MHDLEQEMLNVQPAAADEPTTAKEDGERENIATSESSIDGEEDELDGDDVVDDDDDDESEDNEALNEDAREINGNP